jgi:AhpC/TSA family protein
MVAGKSVAALFALSALLTAAPGDGPLDLSGKPVDPFAGSARARIFLFVRTDCPITNRYAPELQRIASEFARRGAEFWLVYPDPAETADAIHTQIVEYKLPGKALRDPHHKLVIRSQATVSPQAAVFDDGGLLIYSGRIDDRYVDFGKSRPAAQTHDLEAAIAAVLSGKPAPVSRTRAIGCYLADVQ